MATTDKPDDSFLPMVDSPVEGPPLGYRRILKTWWPLAASWMLMSAEGPIIAATMSRLANPTVNLAAFGGLVYPLALVIEAPIVMMLAASVALSRDWDSHVRLRRFMLQLGAAITLIHVIIVATPVYYLVARGLIHAPAAIVEPARIGLAFMIPWTLAIAYRRFYQGVLIRFGHSLRVGLGTVVRFCSTVTVLAVGYGLGSLPGVVVGGLALSTGVLVEALYAYLSVRGTLRTQLRSAPPVATPLTTRALLEFYIPLSITQIAVYIASPLGSAGMSRMPLALESLATWPAVLGVQYLVRAGGMAYNEVVVALVEQPRSLFKLRRFALAIASAGVTALLLLKLTPLGNLVFARLLNLAPPLPTLAGNSLWFLLPIPVFVVAQSYFQGIILYSRRTRSVTEAVLIFLGIATMLLVAGVLWGAATGIYVAIGAFTAGEAVRTFWLWSRSGRARHMLHEHDSTLREQSGSSLHEPKQAKPCVRDCVEGVNNPRQ